MFNDKVTVYKTLKTILAGFLGGMYIRGMVVKFVGFEGKLELC